MLQKMNLLKVGNTDESKSMLCPQGMTFKLLLLYSKNKIPIKEIALYIKFTNTIFYERF